MKYYFSPLFLVGCILIITGLLVFIWIPVVAIGAVAIFLDWIVRRSELSKTKKWVLVVSGTFIFFFFFYSMLGLRSSMMDQNMNY